MDKDTIKKLLQDVKSGKIEIAKAIEILKHLPYEDLGFAKIDTHREIRRGFPEVIFCKGKTIEQIVKIAETAFARSGFVMATKAEPEVYKAINKKLPKAKYHETAKIVLIGQKKAESSDNKRKPQNKKKILVISAGTADLPVAEEAAVTAEIMGNNVERLYDVGVAGVHRFFDNTDKLFSANVIIVAAGMEGALLSVVAGLVDKPVIGIPTSVGYGASFNGLAPLLTMLNSCAPGVAVVNIDNGFGAGYLAGLIARNSG